MIFALVGNQNSGKTTLFNQLTGANQHVGNFPGVTVEQKSGNIRGQGNVTVVDLPGVYSLSPYSSEEVVTRDFILNSKPNGIINIVDSTNIERNLYLTLQLIELKIPMVIALNMIDEFSGNGGSIKLAKFSEELGVPVIPISASKNQGVDELVKVAIEAVKSKNIPKKVDYCGGAVHRCLHGLGHMIEDHATRAGIPKRFGATKIVEGDKTIENLLSLDENEHQMVEHCITEMENELDTDRDAAIADMRYCFIENLCKLTVKNPPESREELRSTNIDRLLTHKYFGIPLFFGIMLIVFWLTFNVIGSYLSDLLSNGIEAFSAIVEQGLISLQINTVVQDLIINGIFSGVGAVLSFLPIIVTLFFFLSMLEDSGYMARVSFIMDKPLRKLGLSGKSFVPMIIGFGCSVPAIMATRTLSSKRDKRMTILLIPFMSCSAKLPVYALLSVAFFPKFAPLVMIGLYVFGVIIGIISSLIFKNTLFRGSSVPFIMELPNYRLPSPKTVALLMWDKARDFLERAFTIIFVATIVIWFLQTFDFRFNIANTIDSSILAIIGSKLSVIFAPLGFGNYQSSTALMTGFVAKEAVVSTLSVLVGTSIDNLSSALSNIFTPLSALSFLVFTLLYTPCVAAIAAVKRELGTLWAIFIVVFQIVIAWLTSFALFQICSLFF